LSCRSRAAKGRVIVTILGRVEESKSKLPDRYALVGT
jgi:hypothetical protein